MVDQSNSALAEIYNFEQMTDWLGTSGQPTREQFAAIADAGYDAVINLALPESDRAIADEGSIIAGLGMHYVHLPVQMENPTLDNLRTFIGVMQALDGKKVWVHCVVNARVSAFVFHYLRKEKNLPEQDARSSILAQWEPRMDDVWKAFLAIPTESLE